MEGMDPENPSVSDFFSEQLKNEKDMESVNWKADKLRFTIRLLR